MSANEITAGGNPSAKPVDTVEPGRGMPELPTRRKSRRGAIWTVSIALACVLIGAVCAITLMHRWDAQIAQGKKAKELKAQSGSSSQGTPIDIAAQQAKIRKEEAEQKKIAEEEQQAEAARKARETPVPAGAMNAGAAQSLAYSGSQQSGTAQNTNVPLTAEQRRLTGDVAVPFDKTGDAPESGADRKTATSPLLAGAGRFANEKGNLLNDDLKPSRFNAMTGEGRRNRSYLLSRNTMIRCIQDTAIITDYPGLTGCTVAADVWSDDGKTLLIRKGAEAKGEQRKAMMQGKGRIFTIWTEIDDGDVSIPLDSPATDALGASGQPAYVDEHFWQRFKGAIMVSLIGDFGQAFANKSTSSGTSQVSFSNSSNATQQLAEETLKNSINIPPTAYSNQGSVINIFVARDVDMSGQYELIDTQSK